MKARRNNGFRVVGWISMLAYLMLAVGPQMLWQCPDGKPCPFDCQLLRTRPASPVDAPASAVPACSHCAENRVVLHSSEGTARCVGGKCQLHKLEVPAAVAVAKHVLFAPVAVIPQALVLVVPDAPSVGYPTKTRILPPPPFLRSHFGRAPPVLS